MKYFISRYEFRNCQTCASFQPLGNFQQLLHKKFSEGHNN